MVMDHVLYSVALIYSDSNQDCMNKLPFGSCLVILKLGGKLARVGVRRAVYII
jgi:hypothetical protein